MEIFNSVVKAAGLWDLQVKKIRRDIEIAGSPERCEIRIVIQDNNDRLYIIESIFDEDIDHKLRIIHSLEHLFQQGLREIKPYICNSKKEYIISCDDRFWQLAPFVDGVSLTRPGYVFDQWRGKVLADFLIKLRAKSSNVPYSDNASPFSIKKYIYELVDQIKLYNPELTGQIKPVVDFLEIRFMDAHDKLPNAFCHGDYHSLNIIWSKDNINTVIDWEFLGHKPEIYDAANLMGCIGIEDPESLSGNLIKDFSKNLKKAEIFSGLSWEYLFELIVAIRFAWLSEWLRYKDKEMLKLEPIYMKLLINNYVYLKECWGI